MNWVLIIVLLTLAICIVHGYRKGFLRIVYSLSAWIVALVLVSWVTPYICQFLVTNTGVYETVEARIEETIRQSASETILTETEGEQTQLAQLGLNLPDSVLEGILKTTTGAADTFMEESGIYTQLAQGLANFVIQGIAFVGALIFTWLLLRLVLGLLGIVSHIPILKGLNRTLGIFAGMLQGLLLVWIAFYAVAVGSTGGKAATIVSYIYESSFLTFLYQNNPVLAVILNIF